MTLKSAVPDRLHYDVRSTLGTAAAHGDFQFKTVQTKRVGVILGFDKESIGVICGFYPDRWHDEPYEEILIPSAIVDLAIE